MSSSLPLRVARKLARCNLGWLVRSHSAWVAWRGGVVSFTFDDFPKSALSAGGAVLAEHRVHGTYYAALGLAGTHDLLGEMFEPDDIRAAAAQGHEVACHTFQHLNCNRTPTPRILADIDENAATLAALMRGFEPVNFAYPYGELSLAAKRALGERFVTCRGIGRGLNCGTTDLADLRATKIHNEGFDLAAFRDLIDRNCALGGWLIFYTHDVCDSPSPYGCTAAQLDAIVAYATGRCDVLPVRDVVAGLGLGNTGRRAPVQLHQEKAA